MVSARAAVAAMPAYRPGRNPADLAREIGVPRAVKLASNEVAFPPLPAVVEAIAATAGETNRYPDNGAVVLWKTLVSPSASTLLHSPPLSMTSGRFGMNSQPRPTRR